MAGAIDIVVSIGVVAGIGGFLALLMVIADATIGNYGEAKLTINNDKEITVKAGRPLLATLMDQKIFIPSACGGRGSCGLCKVKVVEGLGGYLPTELPWLSDEEKAVNLRLSCQVKVKNDLRIEIPEELFNVKQFTAKVASLKNLTHDIKELKLDLSEPKEISCKAGQFVQIQVPACELTDEPVYRAYSMASAPSLVNQIELEIRQVPNGICTTYVHKLLKEGDDIIFNGPYGDFYLRNTDSRIVCIAGGSGMAPIKSILTDMAEKGVKRKTRYFFGARSGQDLFLLEEMKRLEEQLADFEFVPILSEALPEDNWSGKTGLVTDIVDQYLKKEGGQNTEAYLCGSPGMIGACVKVLTGNGIPEELIYYDNFG